MDSHQAKEILLLYRPEVDTGPDEELAAALDLLKRDPELEGWFKEHCAVQKAIRARFQQIPVPEGLKEQILSERKVHLSPGFKRKAAFVGAAVAVAVLLAVLLNRPPGENITIDGFRYRMASLVMRSYPKMDITTNDLRQIQRYLLSQGRGDYSLPSTLAKTPGTGCKVLSWQGKPVSMVCFNSRSTGKPLDPNLFLFVINQSDMADSPSSGPLLNQSGKLAMLTWTDDGKIYLLGALGEEGKRTQNAVAADVRRL